MKNIILLHISIFFSIHFLDAQIHFSLNGNYQAAKPDTPNWVEFIDSGNAKFTQGLDDKGWIAGGESEQYVLVKNYEIGEAFSIACWFKLKEVNTSQVLLQQHSLEAEVALSLEVSNGHLWLIEGADTLTSQAKLTNNFWNLLLFNYEAGKVTVKVETDNMQFYKKALFQQSAQTFLKIGQNGEGVPEMVLDELQVFDYAISRNKTERLFEQFKPRVIVSNKLATQQYFQGRLNELQDSIRISEKQVTLEIWDNDKEDHDRLLIYKNESILSGGLNLKKDKQKLTVNLKEKEVAEILFFAQNMGRFTSFNTASVRVIANGVDWGEYELQCDTATNAVLRITHDPKASPPPPSEKIVMKPFQKTLAPVKVITQEVFLTITDFSIKDGDEIAIKLNEEYFHPHFLSSSKERLRFTLDRRENNFFLQAETTNFLKCTPQIIVTDGNGKEVLKKKLKISGDEVFVLPILFAPPASTQQHLTVDEKNIFLRIIDDQKNDGDILTIEQDGKVLLPNFELTNEPKLIPLELNTKKINVLDFIPESVGKIPPNSCRVSLLKSNQKDVIVEFTLQSYIRENPAQLLIECLAK